MTLIFPIPRLFVFGAVVLALNWRFVGVSLHGTGNPARSANTLSVLISTRTRPLAGLADRFPLPDKGGRRPQKPPSFFSFPCPRLAALSQQAQLSDAATNIAWHARPEAKAIMTPLLDPHQG